MNMNTDREWLLKKAEQEDGCDVRVGGFLLDAKNLTTSGFVLMGSTAEPIVTIHTDGRVTVNPKYCAEEAAGAFWDEVQRLGLSAFSMTKAELAAGPNGELLEKLRVVIERAQVDAGCHLDHDGQSFDDEPNACDSDECVRCAIWHSCGNALDLIAARIASGVEGRKQMNNKLAAAILREYGDFERQSNREGAARDAMLAGAEALDLIAEVEARAEKAEKDYANEDRSHSETMTTRDMHEEDLNSIFSALGMTESESEWSSANCPSAIAIERASELVAERDTLAAQVADLRAALVTADQVLGDSPMTIKELSVFIKAALAATPAESLERIKREAAIEALKYLYIPNSKSAEMAEMRAIRQRAVDAWKVASIASGGDGEIHYRDSGDLTSSSDLKLDPLMEKLRPGTIEDPTT